MPELPELMIMSNYINYNSKGKNFQKLFKVEKGNIPFEYLSDNFSIYSNSNGKELNINLILSDKNIPIYVFMGMSGNWKYVKTEDWNSTKFIRLRFDDDTGHSLVLHGGYMGPKYSINKPFSGQKRGPDPIKNFEFFKLNILENLDKKDFEKPICEVLLNQRYFNGIGAYLNSEIVGRLDINPFKKFNTLSNTELNDLFNMIFSCCNESYNLGGGELISWINPLGKSNIHTWIKFYANKESCEKQKFGTRNIWIKKKFIQKNNKLK